MKIYITTLILFSLQAHSIRFSISNLCTDTKLLDIQTKVQTPTTVSDITLDAFSLYTIDFIGDERAINSIIGTPTDLDAFEIIGDNEMRVYGWCFEVDGVQPDRFMSEIEIKPGQESHINWFYGSAHFKDGAWLTYCTPSFETKSPFICKD